MKLRCSDVLQMVYRAVNSLISVFLSEHVFEARTHSTGACK